MKDASQDDRVSAADDEQDAEGVEAADALAGALTVEAVAEDSFFVAKIKVRPDLCKIKNHNSSENDHATYIDHILNHIVIFGKAIRSYLINTCWNRRISGCRLIVRWRFLLEFLFFGLNLFSS